MELQLRAKNETHCANYIAYVTTFKIGQMASVYVVVQFYPWFKFYFLCFGYGNLMIMSLKQRT